MSTSLTDPLWFIAAGVVLGLIGSLAAVQLLRTMLFQVSTYDASVFIAAAVLLIITALVACAVPAYRATSIDPLEALSSRA